LNHTLHKFCEIHDSEFIPWLNSTWNLNIEGVRREENIQGSPDRTLARAVFANDADKLFLVEKFGESRAWHRRQIALATCILRQNGLLQALGPLKSINGQFLVSYADALFQVTPFVSGTELVRPEYLESADMGRSLAEFVSQLCSLSFHVEKQTEFSFFSVRDYIYEIFKDMKVYDPDEHEKFFEFRKFLGNHFMQIHDTLPICICHGDLHPLNVIWDKLRIKAVIDWEFTGMKPRIYDAANLVGCAGIENPEGLLMPMVTSFLDFLVNRGVFSELEWKFFPEFVLALRFAWLGEWLRKKDVQMLEMEYVYMGLLVDNMDLLRSKWKILK